MLLYLHIPFCDSKCHYCSFNSYVDKFHLKNTYMQALLQQLDFELERFGTQKNSIETLFIGGGTPSTIPPTLFEPIFQKIAPYMTDDAEITSEANPNSATKEWLEGMHALGVNRISFGVQSFDAKKLKLLGRAHTPQQATEAVLDAQKAGYKHISLDLIYAVKGDSRKLLEHDLDQAFTLPIDHLSAYALTIEENTPYAKKPQMADEELEHTRWLFEEIKRRGFTQYEISNFGRYKSRHNLGYWRYEDYIGAGAGAVGKRANIRFYPQNEIDAYIQNPLNVRQEHLLDDESLLEKLFLGLRSEVGVGARLLGKNERERADLLVEEGKLLYFEERFFNPDFLLADEITLFLSNN